VIRVRGLEVRHGSTVAVAGVDLEVLEGERLALLGPSGSGKTSLLRAVAGLERPAAGAVLADRPLALVFQDLALFPHLDVRANVGFGLRRLPRRERDARVAGALATVRLTGLERRRPHELSGGEQQRVALARALAVRPRTLLLDEPLAALDPDLREALRAEVRRVHEQAGAATIVVTHDRDDAFALADRIAILRAGRLEQAGPPEEVYRRPATRFVASFTGEAGFLDAGDGDGALLVLRPEDVRLGDGPLEGRVLSCAFARGAFRYEVEHRGATLPARDARRFEVGGLVRLALAPDRPRVPARPS